MQPQRRSALTAIALALFVIAGLAIYEVLGTVFFAITVAYLLVPLQRRLLNRGTNDWWTTTAVTTGAAVATLVPAVGLVYLVSVRLSSIIGFLTDIPEELSITAFGFTYSMVLVDLVNPAITAIRRIAIDMLSAAPVLAIKFTLFAMVVFALLLRHKEAESALIAPIPNRYHDIVSRLARRARETLYAIYVLQAATALGTFLLALPVFVFLGIPFPFTLALVAAALQFIPIVGPSLLIGVLAIWQVSVGDVSGAILLAVVGGFFIAWLPDILIRPRLSQRTARLPGSLYFIGFTGGLLTLGAIGVVAGPLAIALALTALEILAEEEGTRQSTFDTNSMQERSRPDEP